MKKVELPTNVGVRRRRACLADGVEQLPIGERVRQRELGLASRRSAFSSVASTCDSHQATFEAT